MFGNTKPVTLKTAIFATDEKLTFLDMQMYEDNIINLLNTAEMYILKNIRWKTEIVGADKLTAFDLLKYILYTSSHSAVACDILILPEQIFELNPDLLCKSV